MHSRSLPRLLAGAWLSVILACTMPVHADHLLTLTSMQQQLGRIAADVPVTQLNFTVDGGATALDFDVSSAAPGLLVTIAGPAGQQITASTITGLGGRYTALPATGQADGLLIFPLSEFGVHYRFQLPTLGPGTYTVRAAANGLADQYPVIAQLVTDSPVVTRLLFTDATGIVGRRSVLCAAVIDGASALADASVTVQLVDPLRASHALALLDDGGEVDATAGDGLYCGSFTPAVPGMHSALALISGTAADSSVISRQAAAQQQVDELVATFTGSFTDQGHDTNGNGRYDYVSILAGVEVAVAGNYRATAKLRTAGHVFFEAATDQALAAGSGQVEVRLDGLRLQALNELTEYTIESIELAYLRNGVAQTADVLLNPGRTQLYLLDQLERTPILLPGTSWNTGVDLNFNGRYDQLLIVVNLDVETAGLYQATGRLTDGEGIAIDVVATGADLPAGPGTLSFYFDGRKIGAHGINGPYWLDNVLIHGAGAALTHAGTLARTEEYRFADFEDGQANPADVNHDGQVNCTDIGLVRASMGKRPGQPGFDPRTDINGDGVTNVKDLATVAQALPVGARCP